MIGVLAKDAEYPVICEFFELFKTPWAFYRDNSSCDVLICSDRSLPRTSAALVLVYGSDRTPFDQENGIEILSRFSNTVLLYKGDRIPIYGDCFTFKNDRVPAMLHEATGQPSMVEVASPGQTVVRIGFDLFKEIHSLLIRGQPPANARIPTLDLHIAVLRDLIVSSSIPLVEIPPLPAEYNFIACLTHDVDHVGIRNHRFDHTMFGFLYRATIGSLINFCASRRSARHLAANWMAAFSLPFVHLGLAKDFWNGLDRYLDIEAGLNSTFFVIPKKGDPGKNNQGSAPSRRAARYDISEVKGQLQQLISSGREVALHGIDAWRNVGEARAELTTIKRLTGESNIGVRMHWLFFDEKSFAKLEEAGFSYDSTSGYNETVGYRAGTTQAFRPLGLERMLELPMLIMDTALFYAAYMNLSPAESRAVIDEFLNNATRFGGVLTINWHDRSIAPERLWGDVYVDLLDDLKKKEAWFPTAVQAVSWFRKRRSAAFENVAREGDTIRVKVSMDDKQDALPAMRLRVHKPSGSPTESTQREDFEFAEASLNRSKELTIAL